MAVVRSARSRSLRSLTPSLTALAPVTAPPYRCTVVARWYTAAPRRPPSPPARPRLAYATPLSSARRWTLRRFDVPVLPPGSAPLTVLHLSDLHMTPGQRSKQDWVAGLAALEPDLVVDTGDNLAAPARGARPCCTRSTRC